MSFIASIFQKLGTLLSSLILLALLLGLIEIASPTIELNDARSAINRYLNSITARDIKIDGDIELIVSLNPRLTINRIHIKNLDSFDDEDFITVNKAMVEIPLLTLLQGELHLTDTEVESITLNLHKKADGSYNWNFDHLKSPDVTETEKQLKKAQDNKVIDHFSLGKFQLFKVKINYRDELHQQVFSKQVDELMIDATDKQKPNAIISGNFEEHDYMFELKSNSIELLFSGHPWQLTGRGALGNSSVTIDSEFQSLDGQFDIMLETSVSNIDIGQLLSELGIISGLDIFNQRADISATLHGSDIMELYHGATIRLKLNEGYWNIRSDTDILDLTQASAVLSWNKPVVIDFDARYKDEIIAIKLATNHLKDFFDEITELDVDLSLAIADTEVAANGKLALPIKNRNFLLDMVIKGKDLERLNPIINTEFPPLNDFNVRGNLRFSDKNIILKSATAYIGDTKFITSIVIDREADNPLWNISLKAENFQVNDFIFDDLNPSSTQQSPGTTASTNLPPSRDTSDTIRTGSQASKQALDQSIRQGVQEFEEMLKDPRMHLNLNLSIDNLLIGSSRLGSGRMQLHMRDGVFVIDSADIEVPGGRILTALSLRQVPRAITGSLKLDIDKLDYGIIANMIDPEAQLAGAISTRVDLELRGDSISHSLDHANGIIDLAFWPKNTQPARILNLWTTNLYLILLPELKKEESKVNCLVGLMNVTDGTMKEEFLAIDTTKLWINGNITVNFERQQVDLSLFPASKTARFFAIQTPIRIQGNFTDISPALNPVDLTATYISFITSPLHVPARWIFEDKIPRDGSAICEKFFDRGYVTKLNAELREEQKQTIDELLEGD